MKIFIAAGHGGVDTGAVANGVTERDVVANIVDGAIVIISQYKPLCVELVMVPHDLRLQDTIIYINTRATNAADDICVEVHMNSNNGLAGTGVETYYGNRKLSDVIQKSLVKTTELRNRGVKNGVNFSFNKFTKPASALVELGFINNALDLAIVRQKGSLAIADGILNYVGRRSI